MSWLLVVSESYDASWFAAVTGFTLLAFFASPALIVTTYAFGRPRFLVPPSLRSID